MKNNTIENIIKNTQTQKQLNAIIKQYNDNIIDGVKQELDFSTIAKITDTVNANTKKEFITVFLAQLEKERKQAFTNLFNTPCYDKIIVLENENKTVNTKTIKIVCNIMDIEKQYQYNKSNQTNKSGKAMLNKGVTIFGVLRFYGLIHKFAQNLVLNQVNGENEYKTDLTRIILDDITFNENDGKSFDMLSLTALDKQLRVLTKFFGGLDIKTKKKDINLLKTQIIKLKFDTSVLHLDFQQTKINAFINVLYKYFISVYNKHDTILTSMNANGENVTVNISENKPDKANAKK